ncbi:Oligopeptide transport system permease protein appC [Proteiniborus sp. DW1]|uniref:ABC transporter permease subunit n=1 Tax=Proteiniborus sp. DW1 TaxID=1889883 RepID=UPI00092E0631|nr:ABC transporter permease subunit [Proteiniborus sp. DW1]SCG82330.1 Oligopeptide transport system permease protein appC [Proteiniborus sp. DW1]
MTVKQLNENNKDNKNKKSFFSLLFSNLFGKRKELSILEEEQVQSPWRTVIRTFRENKVAMTGLVVFLLIFITVMIGPLIKPIDLSFLETSQQNVAPGFDIMKFPESLQGNVADISVGPTFSVAASKDGKLHIWGKTKVSSVIDIRNLPQDESNKTINFGKVEKVAAGFDHVLVMNDQGQIYAWGSNRQQQANIPMEVSYLKNIKDIYAGYQCSIVLTEDGRSIFFGNQMNNDYNEFHPYQGQLQKIAVTADAAVGLTFDGQVVYLGMQQNGYSTVPSNMGKVVDIAATASTMAALNDEGKVIVWGNVTKGEADVPQTDEKIVSIYGGRYHYTAVTEKGNVLAWGSNYYNETVVPEEVKKADMDRVYTGFYQNYGITKDGKIITWGLKGYLCGTDDLGRDIFTRLLNGGRMSMTIGAVAVIISTVIGIIVGSLSGFLGGKVDIVLQRLSEVVAALPFLPFAMILSALIGNSLTSTQRIVLIMVILGLLSWTGLQRLVRAQVLSVREQEYVVAARSLGIKKANIIFKHILPNVISIILVSATLNFATSMLTESSLSYLGFGVQAPHPTWGNMLFGANNSVVIQNYWWRWVFASIVLGICVICINLIGDGLRDAIDPRSQER